MNLLSLVMLSQVSGTVWTVDDDWSSADFSSIQDAVDQAADGDVIRVYEGIYFESLTLDRSITITGNGSSTVVDGNHIGSVITIISENVTIEGLDVRNSNLSSGMSGIRIEASHTAVRNCTVTWCRNGILIMAQSGDLENITLVNTSVYRSICGVNVFWNVTAIRTINMHAKLNMNAFHINCDADVLLAHSTLADNDIGILVRSGCLHVISTHLENNTRHIFQWSGYVELRNSDLHRSDDEHPVLLNDGEVTSCRFVDSPLAIGRSVQITNSTFIDCSPVIEWTPTKQVDFLNITSSTVNGKPVFAFFGKTQVSVDESAGFVMLVNCTNVLIRDLNISNTTAGMVIYDCKNVTLSSSEVTLSRHGALIYGSTEVRIVNSRLTDCRDGISFAMSDDVSIMGSMIEAFECGIYSESTRNITVADCAIKGGSRGGMILSGENITVSGTSISGANIGIQAPNAKDVLLLDLTLSDNAIYGIQMAPKDLIIRDVRVKASLTGIYLHNGSDVRIENSTLVGCRIGITTYNIYEHIMMRKCELRDLEYGVVARNSGAHTMILNRFRNTTALIQLSDLYHLEAHFNSLSGEVIVDSANSFYHYDWTFNQWLDFHVNDTDGDGVGDLPLCPYRDVYDLYPLVGEPVKITPPDLGPRMVVLSPNETERRASYIHINVLVASPVGVKSVNWRFDGGEWQPMNRVTSPCNVTYWTASLSSLRGTHMLEIEVIDTLGRSYTERMRVYGMPVEEISEECLVACATIFMILFLGLITILFALAKARRL